MLKKSKQINFQCMAVLVLFNICVSNYNLNLKNCKIVLWNVKSLDIAKNCACVFCQVSLQVPHYIIPKGFSQAPVTALNYNCFLPYACHDLSDNRIFFPLFHIKILASVSILEKTHSAPGHAENNRVIES